MMDCALDGVHKMKGVKLHGLHGILHVELKHSLARDAYTTDSSVFTGARQGVPKKAIIIPALVFQTH